MKDIKIGSMFCGMGGFDTGLKEVGFKTIWAIDVFKEATESFKANYPDTVVLNTDVFSIQDYKELGDINGLVFGPPCQGFSRANAKRSMSDSRNFAYLATLKALEQTNVEFFIFENVRGLLDMKFNDGSSVFKKIKSDYENAGAGYNVSCKLIDCANVGVPQLNRFRLIMIGFRKNLGYKYHFDEEQYGEGKLPYVTLRDTIWHLKNIDQRGMYYDGAYDWKYLSRNRQKPWSSPSYTIEASGRYAKLHPGFGKMEFISQGKWYIPPECRRMSTLEEKLLQTFPEDYIVCGNLDNQYIQIGNAVPPKLAKYIGAPISRYYYNKIYNYNSKSNRDYNGRFNKFNEIVKKNSKEMKWLSAQIRKYPNNKFYISLINRIESGKDLTPAQRKYIKIDNYDSNNYSENYYRNKKEKVIVDDVPKNKNLFSQFYNFIGSKLKEKEASEENSKELQWLYNQIEKYPDNKFYMSLINRIESGKGLTSAQKKYIKI